MPRPVVVLSILLVLTLAGWLGFDYLRDRLGASDCDAVTTITVTAAPDIAPVVAKLAEQDTAGCHRVEVSARDSATAVQAPTGDVWIPESSLWLRRAQENNVWNIPVTGTSVASSPVVLALTDATASRLGWPGRTPTWGDVLAADTAIAFPDPGGDPAGVSTLIGTVDVTKTAADPAGAYALALRKLAKHTVPNGADIFAHDAKVDGYATSETSAVKRGLVAVYPDAGVPSLDYPFIVLPGADETKRAAAQQFLAKLLDQAATTQFAEAALRAPDGRTLQDRSQDKRTSSAAMPAVAPPADTDQLLNQWAGISKSARIQVLLDVSGSMAQTVPPGKLDRMTVTLQAAELGIKLFKPTSKIGVWRFSTNLDADKDYKELVPVLPVGEQLNNGALDKLRAVKPISGGATGMYDSVLAAYQSARANWEPGRINLVVVLTDGRNEDRKGISRAQLIAELAKLQDPRRPLQVMGIGIGPDIDAAELREISQATGGEAFTTPDPTKITDIFYAAMGRLL